MLLKKLVVSGFKSISNQYPQTLNFEPDLTALIGHNGTGKSTALEALNKLFALDHSLRSLTPSDFHLPDDSSSSTNRELSIEAWFVIGSIRENADNAAVPTLLDGLTFSALTNETYFRVRLEASLDFDINPMGDIEENIWVIDTDQNELAESNKSTLPASHRNAIQVHYVPAKRDPLSQLKFSSGAILGRLLRAIEWSDSAEEAFTHKADELNRLALDNLALAQIVEAINLNWRNIYKGRHLSEAKLHIPVANVEQILKLIQLKFMPDATGNPVDTSRLSDGQKSLVYFVLIKALFDIDKTICQAKHNRVPISFNIKKIKLPIFTLMVLEEPENHLSPHYLGRITKLMQEYGATEFCQSVLSTHSSSLIGRIEPKQIRHFRLDNQSKSTRIQALVLPSNKDEQAKYISEAVKAYPEIYFAKLVILGEGDSEQLVVPKLLEHSGKDIDAHSISIVPLGGRHVNHFWRLLKALEIPFVTLLDFDIDRNGGGFGRLKYAMTQLGIMHNKDYSNYINNIPNWDDPRDPTTFALWQEKNKNPIVIRDFLERQNVFFSSPLDIDYSLICSFPDIFCVKDEAFGERGPTNPQDEGERTVLTNKVLKQGNIGKRYDFGSQWEQNFLWYRYRFLSNKSKPASHLRMFSLIEDKYSSQEILQKLPLELSRLINRVIELSSEMVE